MRHVYIYIYVCNACVQKERAVAKEESEEPGDHEKTSLPKGEDIYLGLLHLTTRWSVLAVFATIHKRWNKNS